MTERIALTEVQFKALKPEDKIYDNDGKEIVPRPTEFKEGEFFGTPVVAADGDPNPTADTTADDSSEPDDTSKTDKKPKTDEEMDAIVKNGTGVLIEALVLTNDITKDYALKRPELNDEQKDKISRMGADPAAETDGTPTTPAGPPVKDAKEEGQEGQTAGRRRSKRRQPRRSAKQSKKGGRSRKNRRKQSRRRKH